MLGTLGSTERPIVVHVSGVRVPKLFLAVAALIPVGRILREFLPMIRRAPLALAVFHAADHLIRAIARWFKELLAIWTASCWHHASHLNAIAKTGSIGGSDTMSIGLS